ncbi:MAG: ABC transporter substrate-binding protein [Janthinobacterium lividum]
MKRRSLLLTALLPLAARAQSPVVVRVGWLRAPNDITLGRARGTIERAVAAHGATIQWAGPFAAAAPALEALNAGAIDVTAGSSTASITGLAAGVPLVVFAYQKISAAAEGILVKHDAPMKTLADLKGHTVAVNRGGTGEYLLMRGLAHNGVDPATVKRIYLGPADAGSAFDGGHVDAWATWDPFIAIAVQNYGARVLADGAQIGSDNAVTLMASTTFAATHRNLLQVLLDTARADNAWSMEHKSAAGGIWAKAMGIPSSLGDAIGVANAVPTTAVTPANLEQMKAIAAWYSESGIIPVRSDIARSVVMLE